MPSALPRAASGAVAAPALALAVAHGLNDTYTSFIHPLLPRIMDKLGLSIAMATGLSITMSLSASITQPALGRLADRHDRRLFVILGPVCAGVFLSLIGLAPSYTTLLVVLILGGLGSAAFHPAAASLAAGVTDGKGSASRYSIFSFGGAVGYALGPLIAVGIVARFGLEMLWIAILPIAAVAIPLWKVMPGELSTSARANPSSDASLWEVLRGPLGVLFLISATGTFVQRTFLTMEPIIVSEAGGSESLGAIVISVYLGAQALGTVVGGRLADRMERRTLIATLALLSIPAHVLALMLPIGSPVTFVFVAAAGFLYMSLYPAIVVTAQEVMPGGAAVSSGIVMGLAWGVGALGVLGAGVVGDALGARNAALLATPALLVAAACARSKSLTPGRP